MHNKKMTLRNDFHNTTYSAVTAIGATLSPDQIRRAKKALCSDAKCTCSDRTGIRGTQDGFTIQKLTGNVFQLVDATP